MNKNTAVSMGQTLIAAGISVKLSNNIRAIQNEFKDNGLKN